MDFVREWRVFDYITCIFFGIVAAAVGTLVQPHCRSFVFSDTSINRPEKDPETFPTYSVIIAVVLVVFIYAAGEFFTWRGHGRRVMLRHLNAWILVQAFSVCLEFCVVNLCKLYAGRLRPDFIHRLAKEGITENNFGQFTHEQVCRAAREGRLSFPSGHTGSSFAGFVPPVLYLLGLTRTLRTGALYTAGVSLLPLAFPLVTSISRTRDNDHHFADIVAGAVIGTFSALFSVLISFVVSPEGKWMIRSESFTVSYDRRSSRLPGENPIEDSEAMVPCAVNVVESAREEN
ncbi:phosphatidic acid phosphatase [Trypanosoma conorhini]|uniref:Phosphatidic acid phosphatase n=1 Tax=Trypanosoma conorhini TaxID=83891 RepID=A0A422PX68_9TRYP|nr:phosphatidic acid phosphatase [Trypanosoma conorhini]RNF22371.1 phosphatidic acid phosphatase [Trypanosoma conorhini]